MADLKISELGSLAGGDLVAGDELAIVDGSASETKKIGVGDLIENGVTLISDDAIPGAKILFAAGDIASASLADDAVTTAKVADNAITAAKLADESTVDLVTTLPASGAFTGQLALDTDDNKLYVWDGSSWLTPEAGVSDVDGSTAGIVNIVSTVSSNTVTISATLDDTTAAAQFLAGPVGAAGTVGYRAIDGGDLPAATTTSKGGVIVNGNGLQMSGDNIQIANTVSSSSTRHLVTYDANGLVTGGAAIAAGDLPLATTTTAGGVIVGDGLDVNASGVVSVDNTVTAGEYTKVTVTERGLVSSGGSLDADDIPDHSAAKITSGTIGTSRIASDAITAAKLADQSTTKFGGAAGSDNVTIFPAGDFKGQFFYDETTQDLYIYTGSAFVPVTVLSGNLVNAGAYNASTNQMSSVTSAGSSAGFSVGNALPAPAKTNLNHYVVVDTSGTGTGAAPAVALAPPDMLLSQGVGTEYSLIDVSNAIAGQTASNISLIATGDVVATDVQAAITELDTEKLPKAGGTMTGDLELNNADIVFEGSTADDYETTLTVTDPTADRTITLPNITGTVITTGDTGSVTSTMILDGTIANADISSSAEIAVSKLAKGTARQLLQTNAAGTAPEFTSSVDIPGTLDVTDVATFDSTATVTGLLSANGQLSVPAGSTSDPGLYFGTDTDTGIYSPGSNKFGITTNGTAALTVDASQRLLLGTTTEGNSAADNLTIADSANCGVTIRSGTSNYGSIYFSDGTSGNSEYRGQLEYNHSTDAFSIYTAASTAMRIDSSGKVGIGTTSPSKKLEISASSAEAGIALSSSGRTLVMTSHEQSGVSQATKIGTTSNHELRIITNDTERMRIDSSGRVIIGHDSSYGVADADDLQVGDNTNSAERGISIGSTTAGNIAFADSADSRAGLLQYAHSDNSLRFFVSGVSAGERMRIDSSGQVGIGTTSPGAKLGVAGHVRLGNQFNGDGTTGIVSTNGVYIGTNHGSTTSTVTALQIGGYPASPSYSGSPDQAIVLDGWSGSTVYHNAIINRKGRSLSFHTAITGLSFSDSNERMRIDSSGRLLHNTTATGTANIIIDSQLGNGSALRLIGKSANDGSEIDFYADNNSTRLGYLEFNNTVTKLVSETNVPLSFYANATERMRLQGNGTLNCLHTDNGVISRSTVAAGTSKTVFIGQHSATGITNGATSIKVFNNGNVQNTNDSYGQLSDVKLKENIVDAPSQWEDFKAVRFRKYNFKEETGHETHTQLGVIAQELELTSPGLVYETPDVDDEGNDLGTTTKAVKSSILTKKALVALQEAMDRIETLEAKVAALEAGN